MNKLTAYGKEKVVDISLLPSQYIFNLNILTSYKREKVVSISS
jgi:hypothetical protein